MKADLVAPVDLHVNTIGGDASGESQVQNHQEHPAVLPRLTYSITDLWAGRITEAVRDSWDALLSAIEDNETDEPDEYQGLPRTEYTKIHDRSAPDIQRVIAEQSKLIEPAALRAAGVPVHEPQQTKKPNWGRLMARGS